VRILVKSQSGIFDVAWRSTARARSSFTHSVAIIDDANELASALFDGDIDLSCFSVSAFFDKFFYCRCGTLYDLASGDLINRIGSVASRPFYFFSRQVIVAVQR